MIFTLNNSSRLEKITAPLQETKIIRKPEPVQPTGRRKPPVKTPKTGPLWAMVSGIGD